MSERIEWLPPTVQAPIPPGTWRQPQLTSPGQPTLDPDAVDQAARTLLDEMSFGTAEYAGDNASEAYLIAARVVRSYLAAARTQHSEH